MSVCQRSPVQYWQHVAVFYTFMTYRSILTVVVLGTYNELVESCKAERGLEGGRGEGDEGRECLGPLTH